MKVFTARNYAKILFLLFVSFSLYSQEGASFAPFVTGLEGEVKNNLLRLSWKDSPDVRGPVYIYRSENPFGEEIDPASLGRPVTVPYGAESYIDETEPGTWYYFLAASDEDGRRFLLLLPPRNTVGIKVLFEGLADAPPPPVSPAGSGISGVRADVQGGAVIVSFIQSGEGRAVLYRSAQPLRTTQDLLRAVIVQSDVSPPYTDYPVPGIPYYYAVVPEADLVRGNTDVVPGQNATASPVEVALEEGRVGLSGSSRAMRDFPLPLVSPAAAVPGLAASYRETPAPVELSPEAAKALENLPAVPPKARPEKQSFVLKTDLDASSSGEGYALSVIIKGPFMSREWDAAREELLRYLSLPRSDEAVSHARFYLGQCYYFSGRHREALFEFLAARTFCSEALEWIQTVLPLLGNK